MITSITETQIKTIYLDRLLVNKNNTPEIVIDPIEIKKEVNSHFQSIAGSVNRRKTIPEQWIPYYDPIPNINQHIYTSLLDHITDEE